MVKRPLSLLAAVLCGACAGGAALDAPAPTRPGGLARGEHITVGVHTDVSGVAASRTLVFAATQDALLIYDVGRANWLPPLTRDRGYPGGPVSIIAADPVEDGVWLGSAGWLLYYRPHVDLLTSAVLPGSADAIMFDEQDMLGDAFVRSGAAWARASRVGVITPVSAQQLPPPARRVTPPTLRDVYREFPSLQSFAVLLTRDARLRSWPVSSGTRAPDRSEVFLGTRGNGLYRVDPIFQDAQHLPYGLLEEGAGALAPAADGVWVGGMGRSPTGRGGVTYASDDLQRWLWLEGSTGSPIGRTRIEALAVRGTAVWVASDRGVLRLDSADPEQMTWWTLTHGLPADHALAILPVFGGTWVGTTRGLAFLEQAEEGRLPRVEPVRALGPLARVRSLLLIGESLWVGSDAGLLLAAPASAAAAPRRAPAVNDEPRLSRPIRALASADTILLAATSDEVFALDARTGRALERPAGLDAAALRGITALAMDGESIWTGGSAGVLVTSRTHGTVQLLRVGRELPGEVNAVLLGSGVAWIATRRGLVRLERYPNGGVR